ncbi:MAG: hypothetical protein RL695_952 [Pseudomonadota bacterium]|jgi:mono/diheme cytochrome c family protein
MNQTLPRSPRRLCYLLLLTVFSLTSAYAAAEKSAAPQPLVQPLGQTPTQPPTQPLPPESRGAMLYSVSCNGCHSKNLHWRAQKQVTDQTSLLREVLRWRDNAQASWSEADSKEVARYLNTTYYQFAH